MPRHFLVYARFTATICRRRRSDEPRKVSGLRYIAFAKNWAKGWSVHLRFRSLVITLTLFGPLLMQLSGPVQAQGLFDTIRGIFGRGFAFEEDRHEGPYQAYCVRLCDGRFFPLPASEARERERERGYNRSRGFFFRDYPDERRPSARTTGDASPDNLCKAMCPATPVKVFSGTLIDNAVAADGMSYARLQNAFVYREKMIPECTCNGMENTGLSNLDPASDPTLQPGDIVVTAEGVKIYRGGSGQEALVPVNEYRGMPESMRRNLSAIRITRTPEPVTARAGIPPQQPAATRGSAPASPVPSLGIP